MSSYKKQTFTSYLIPRFLFFGALIWLLLALYQYGAHVEVNGSKTGAFKEGDIVCVYPFDFKASVQRLIHPFDPEVYSLITENGTALEVNAFQLRYC